MEQLTQAENWQAPSALERCWPLARWSARTLGCPTRRGCTSAEEFVGFWQECTQTHRRRGRRGRRAEKISRQPNLTNEGQEDGEGLHRCLAASGCCSGLGGHRSEGWREDSSEEPNIGWVAQARIFECSWRQCYKVREYLVVHVTPKFHVACTRGQRLRCGSPDAWHQMRQVAEKNYSQGTGTATTFSPASGLQIASDGECLSSPAFHATLLNGACNSR
jgi:hypothetical protein